MDYISTRPEGAMRPRASAYIIHIHRSAVVYLIYTLTELLYVVTAG